MIWTKVDIAAFTLYLNLYYKIDYLDSISIDNIRKEFILKRRKKFPIIDTIYNRAKKICEVIINEEKETY